MESLVFYDYVTTDPITALALGVVAPRSSDDTVLRIGNTSDTYQAEDITVSVVSTGDDHQLWLSLDGDVFTASILVGDVPPNSLSGPFWLRRVTASTEPDGDCTAVIAAVPAAWTSTVDAGITENIPLATPDNPPDD